MTKLEDWRARFIPDPIWLALGAVSGFIAGRVTGREVFRISIFQHTTAATVVGVFLLLAFFLSRKRLPDVSGWCLWFGMFSIGIVSLR